MNSIRKILLISYDYFPDSSPNTYRWHNILKVWAEQGHKVFVVSAQKPGFSKSEVIDGIQIYRTGQSWLEILKSKIPKHINIEKEVDSLNSTALTKESVLKRIYNATFKQIYFPDFAFLWSSPGEKLAAKLIKERHITNVITVSWPFTDHVIGYRLKKKFDINWIADTIDPFYLSDAVNNANLYKKINLWLENKVLSMATYVPVLTNKLKDKYLELYPSLKNKVIVNHNIFIPYSFEKNNTDEDSITRLVFFGTLTPKTRSPRTLLQLISQIDKLPNIPPIEFHIYGDTSQCNAEFENFQYLIGKRLFIHGLVSKEVVKKYSESANVLVNIGNTNEYQEPSKIIEYIYMGKPILNICSISNDSSRELLDQYPNNFNFYKEDLNNESTIGALLEFISGLRNAEANNLNSSEILKNYLLPEVQQCYFNLLQEEKV